MLFGEVWSREDQLPLKLRSLVTVTALISKGIVDSSLKYHLESARNSGVTAQEMAETLTHIAFYAGWPNAWAAFRMAKEVYGGKEIEGHGGFFGQGQPNTAFAQYFDGQSYLQPLTDPKETVFVANVTFEPGCRNHWHIHHAKRGGGQFLLCVDGRGWYQEEGKPAQALHPGDVVTIPAEVKHWHGARADCWFSHLAGGGGPRRGLLQRVVRGGGPAGLRRPPGGLGRREISLRFFRKWPIIREQMFAADFRRCERRSSDESERLFLP